MTSFTDVANSAARLWSAQRIAVEVDGPEGAHRNVLVDKPFARVGRDQRSEVPLSDGSVLPCHLYLQATEEGVYYVGLASGAPSGWMLPSESVQVGPFQLRASLADGLPGGASPKDLQAKQNGRLSIPQLRVFSSSRSARFTDLRLSRPLTLLGRESPATRRLNHPTISRVHCAVFWNGQELWLVDFFSSNGTRLAGKKFDFGRLLVGQEFKLGSVRFIYLGTKKIDASVADGSAFDQPVGILAHDDDAEGNDSERPLAQTETRSSVLATVHAGRDEHFSSIEHRLEALRQQCERFERERNEVQHQLLQGRDANQERLVAIREEVTALQHGSESAAREFQRLSNEIETTREELFARYADVAPRSAEEAARAGDERLQIADALQNAETRWTELAQDLSRRTVELQRQMAEGQQAHLALAGSIRREREQTQRRVRSERRAYRRRLAHAKREFAAELARLHEESTAGRQDVQPIEAGMARVQPAPTPGEAHSKPGELHHEAVKRHEEELLLAASHRQELSEAIERRATGLAQQIADGRQADLEMAERFQDA
jgi:pSer/pThr/pTyr-binding forkhead associated (FHA) protein